MATATVPLNIADAHQIARDAVVRFGASQDTDELAAVLEVVASIRPQVIVEIGCDRGGTLYAWRQICERVYGITLADNSVAVGGSDEPLVEHGANVLIGDSHDLASMDWLQSRVASIDVLVIDGDHSSEGVLADFTIYGPLVRGGGLILIHDIAVKTDRRCEVWQVWPEIAQRFERTATIGHSYGWGVIYT